MAFALALKSLFDFPGVGNMFLLITLIITAFTLIYSSLFLETTLNNCGIILNDEVDIRSNEVTKNSFTDNNSLRREKNIFANVKDKMIEMNSYYFMPLVDRKPAEPARDLKSNLLEDFENTH
jgi:hypothetical protein